MPAPRPIEAPPANLVDLRFRAAKFMTWYVNVLFVFSLFFQVWAIRNNLHAVYRGKIIPFQYFDYGALSFLGVILSCSFFRVFTIPKLNDIQEDTVIPVSTKYWFSGSQMLVSLNYFFIAVLKHNKFLYCFTFFLGWLILSIMSFREVGKCIAISKLAAET